MPLYCNQDDELSVKGPRHPVTFTFYDSPSQHAISKCYETVSIANLWGVALCGDYFFYFFLIFKKFNFLYHSLVKCMLACISLRNICMGRCAKPFSKGVEDP